MEGAQSLFGAAFKEAFVNVGFSQRWLRQEVGVMRFDGDRRSELRFDPGNEPGKGSPPGIGVVLAREQVGQFVTQGHELLARRMEHNAAGFMKGFAQEKGAVSPIFPRVREIIRVVVQADRLLSEGFAEPLDPGLQFLEGAQL
jgi:hypothetical protein